MAYFYIFLILQNIVTSSKCLVMRTSHDHWIWYVAVLWWRHNILEYRKYTEIFHQCATHSYLIVRHFWLAIFGRAHIWSNPYLVLTHIWSKPIFGRGHIWTNQIWSVPYLVHPNLVCAEFGAGIRGPLARGSYHKGPFLKILWPKDLQNQRTFGY